MPRQHLASRGRLERAARVALDVSTPRPAALAVDVLPHMPMLAVPAAARVGSRPNCALKRTHNGPATLFHLHSFVRAVAVRLAPR